MFFLATIAARGQEITFYSTAFEEGVRLHLSLDDSSPVLQSQMDTIKNINLSGLGITDIRDAVYLPNVENLNLSYNALTDVSPLLSLDSLKLLRLDNNQLEDISVLALSQADSIVVDISHNHVADFSFFFSPTKCRFTILGMGLQTKTNSPFFDVSQLYGDVEEGNLVVRYRGYSNMSERAYVKCGSYKTVAQMNGEFITINAPGPPTTTKKANLSNGVKGDTTYVVPPIHHELDPGQTVTLSTGLPSSYKIGYANALKGTVTIQGLKLKYTAPSSHQVDTLYFSYYKGRQLKGFSQFYVGKEYTVPTIIQQTEGGESLKLAWQDGKLLVTCPQGALGGCTEAAITVWNAAGQLLASEDVDASHGIDTVLNVSARRGNVAIVQVDCCGRRLIGKCFLAQ